MHPDRRQALFQRVERATEMPMLALAVAFLVAIGLPELLDLSQAALDVVEALVWLVWALFAFELLAKTYLAPDRLGYLRTHWLDVLTVAIPFLRPLRLLALLGVGVRLAVEARTALRHQTFGFIGVVSLATAVLSAALVYVVERGGEGPIQTFPDALWWAAATITTVGYGDVYPKTPPGRMAAVVLMLVGISLFGLLTARVAAFFVEEDQRQAQDEKLDEILRRLDRLDRGPGAPGDQGT